MLDALMGLFTTTAIFYLVFGALLGLVVGVLPALGGAAGLSLLIPFIYGMDPSAAMAMIIGMLATVSTGDTITSVLLGIPGSASSQATVLDGFPLAKSGQGARALSAGFLSSLLGGLFGALLLTATLQVARQVVLWFGMPEILMMILFGMASVAALSGRSLAKGIAICAFGMVAASVGFAPATGEERMTFDLFYLSNGLPLLACVIGVFVVPEIVDLLRRNRTIASQPTLGAGARQGVLDVLRNRWLVLRSAGVGALVGAMPGVGGSVVDWIVYGQTVRGAKDKSQFGKGDIRGVIGVESSNNAVLGGALVPTLLFGIPGSGSTALLLSALIMLGVQPGPSMLGADISLTYSMIWSLALANVIGACVCFGFARQLAKITLIPFVWIAPFLIVAIAFATLQINRDPRDLLLVLLFGAIGVFMRRFGFSRPAFLIGFVLQGNLERSFYQTSQIYAFWDFITRPIVLVLMVIVASILLSALRNQLKQKHAFATPELAARLRATRPLQVLMPLALMGIFAMALWSINDLQHLGRIFPQIVAGVGLAAAAVAGVQVLLGQPAALEDQEQEGTAYSIPTFRVAGWLAVAVISMIAFGFFAGSALFLMLFLSIEARAKPWTALAGVFGIVGVYLVLMYQSGTFLPDGWVLALNPWTYF
ncbi:tripartite tricarboxylate transporter permease [Nioella sp.]|uniref:tripartite tricarboxylate transporter permease n=1 Tax=Nioella sp. TaxID=1912091 RepID=UPI0035126544